MALLNKVRLGLFIVLSIFSLIVLGILCYFTSLTDGYLGVYLHSFALGIATSLLTLITVNAVLIIDRVRKSAVPSRVWFELLWSGILWVLWVGTAGSITSLGVVSCGLTYGMVESLCRQYQAVQAFSWLNWLMMFGWFITLIVLSFMTSGRGHNEVWQSPTTEAPFFAPEKQNTFQGPGVTPAYTGTYNPASTAAYGGSYATPYPTGTTSPAPQQYPQQQYPQQYAYGSPQPAVTQPYPGSPPPQQYGPQQGAQPGYPQQGYPQQGYPQQGHGPVIATA